MVEDVTQETMLIVYRYWQKIDEPRHYALKVANLVAARHRDGGGHCGP